MLAREPGSKQIALAERLDMEPITLSRIIDKLEQADLVRRVADPTDRRAWRLELTDKACPLHAQLMTLAGEVSLDAFAGFAPEEIDQARALLARIRANLVRYDETANDKKAVA